METKYHVCRMYNNLCQVNVRFRDITHILVSMLPSIYLSNGGELGIVSVRSLIKKKTIFEWCWAGGAANSCQPNWENAWLDLRFRSLGWFIILNIFWRKSHKKHFVNICFVIPIKDRITYGLLMTFCLKEKKPFLQLRREKHSVRLAVY